MKVGHVICVADFHDLCPRHVRDFVGNLSRTLSHSRRNGIWAIRRDVMKFIRDCTLVAYTSQRSGLTVRRQRADHLQRQEYHDIGRRRNSHYRRGLHSFAYYFSTAEQQKAKQKAMSLAFFLIHTNILTDLLSARHLHFHDIYPLTFKNRLQLSQALPALRQVQVDHPLRQDKRVISLL